MGLIEAIKQKWSTMQEEIVFERDLVAAVKVRFILGDNSRETIQANKEGMMRRFAKVASMPRGEILALNNVTNIVDPVEFRTSWNSRQN